MGPRDPRRLPRGRAAAIRPRRWRRRDHLCPERAGLRFRGLSLGPAGAKPVGRGRTHRPRSPPDPAAGADGRSGAGTGDDRLLRGLGAAPASGHGPLCAGWRLAQWHGAAAGDRPAGDGAGGGRAGSGGGAGPEGLGFRCRQLVRLGAGCGGGAGLCRRGAARCAGAGRDPGPAAARYRRHARPCECANAGAAAAGGGGHQSGPRHADRRRGPAGRA